MTVDGSSEEPAVEGLRDAVRDRYARAATEIARSAAPDLPIAAEASCCGTSCCDGSAATDVSCGAEYDAAELAALGLSATASLGCGNPTLIADLRPGETVLDLGSGAGLDVLVSARRVGPTGHAYGVDMTAEMLLLSRANQAKAGVSNATFLEGTLEALPLPDATVDVVVSNCVINLAADKRAVLREAFRVLRPGGRFAVADMVALAELAPETKRRLDLWAGCVAGTIPVDEYVAALEAAGFRDVDIEVVREIAPPELSDTIASAYIRARKKAN